MIAAVSDSSSNEYMDRLDIETQAATIHPGIGHQQEEEITMKV